MSRQAYPLGDSARTAGARRTARMRERKASNAGLARWLVAAGIVAMSAAAPPAFGQTATGAGQEPAEAVAAGAELSEVDAYRLALLKMRGHLAVARTLVRLGADGAEYHVETAPRRLFQGIQGRLEERGAPLSGDTLDELGNVAMLEPARALPAIESAVNAINGSFAQTGGMDAASVLDVVEGLLRAAVASYAGAVEENAVTDLRGYQTGGGFVTQAEALVRHSTALQDLPGQDALLRQVTLIRQAWPGIRPPPIVFDPASVEGRLDEALATMEAMR